MKKELVTLELNASLVRGLSNYAHEKGLPDMPREVIKTALADVLRLDGLPALQPRAGTTQTTQLSDPELRVLELVKQSSGILTVLEMAEALKVGHLVVRERVKALLGLAFIEKSSQPIKRTGPGAPRIGYQMTAAGLKACETEQLARADKAAKRELHYRDSYESVTGRMLGRSAAELEALNEVRERFNELNRRAREIDKDQKGEDFTRVLAMLRVLAQHKFRTKKFTEPVKAWLQDKLNTIRHDYLTKYERGYMAVYLELADKVDELGGEAQIERMALEADQS